MTYEQTNEILGKLSPCHSLGSSLAKRMRQMRVIHDLRSDILKPIYELSNTAKEKGWVEQGSSRIMLHQGKQET